MARIKNVDLPNKRIEIALTYIHGIGRRLSRDILTKLNINLDTKANDLTDEEISKIRILPGDTVVMEISPYDLTRGRITYRK